MEWIERDGVWELHHVYLLIWMQPRPAHCDRGRWLAHVEVAAEYADLIGLDGADLWPRYYFDLDRAKAECEAWLTKRVAQAEARQAGTL